jgi:hypothetical protein
MPSGLDSRTGALADRLITERALARLPGPRLMWVLAWAALVPCQAWLYRRLAGTGTNTILDLDAMDAALGFYLVGLTLVGARFIVVRAEQIEPVIRRVARGDTLRELLRGYDWWPGPLIVAGALTALEMAEAVMTAGWAPLLISPIVLAVHIPTATAGWVVLAVFLSLDRLGRLDLDLDPFSGDPTLGLKPVGRLAFSAFAIVLLAGTPVLLRFTTSALALVINVPLVGLPLAAFAFVLGRVHARMRVARAEGLETARQLTRSVLAPVLEEGSATILSERAMALSAAESLERRVERVKTWPVTGGIVGQTVVIVVSVLTALVTRWVFVLLGL